MTRLFPCILFFMLLPGCTQKTATPPPETTAEAEPSMPSVRWVDPFAVL